MWHDSRDVWYGSCCHLLWTPCLMIPDCVTSIWGNSRDSYMAPLATPKFPGIRIHRAQSEVSPTLPFSSRCLIFIGMSPGAMANGNQIRSSVSGKMIEHGQVPQWELFVLGMEGGNCQRKWNRKWRDQREEEMRLNWARFGFNCAVLTHMRWKD